MGTSQSSAGPGGGVALVPPWADAIDLEDAGEGTTDQASDSPGDGDLDGAPATDAERDAEDALPGRSPIAPPGRFGNTRRSLGRFARSGNTRDMRRSLGHYVRGGYGGSATMTRRLAGTAVTAGRLGTLFETGRTEDGTTLRDAALARGSDADAVLDAVVDAARPADGTQDSESSRQSVREATSDLLERFPDADLFSLTDEQREYVIERFAALDVYGRFCLDLNKTVLSKAPDTSTAMRRLKSIREYIHERVSASFRKLREQKSGPTSQNIARLTKAALRETLEVFEEYIS